MSQETLISSQSSGHLDRPTELNPQRLLSRTEVDHIFGIPKRFLELAACKGSGPAFVKIGRLSRYRVVDVTSWIACHRYENTSQVTQENGDDR
jgi:hypothetical protein